MKNPEITFFSAGDVCFLSTVRFNSLGSESDGFRTGGVVGGGGIDDLSPLSLLFTVFWLFKM